MIAIPLVVATAGRVVLTWRAVAIDGFGLGDVNRPLLLWSPVARVLIWLVGQALFWAGLFLAFAFAWYWVIVVGAISYTLGKVLIAFLFRSHLADAHAMQQAIRKKSEGKDAATLAMEMHYEHGSISKEQFQEFKRSRGTDPRPPGDLKTSE